MLRYDGPFINVFNETGRHDHPSRTLAPLQLPVITAGPALAAAHYAACGLSGMRAALCAPCFLKPSGLIFFRRFLWEFISILAGAVIGTDLYLLSARYSQRERRDFYAGSYRVSFHSLRDSYAVAVAGTCNL